MEVNTDWKTRAVSDDLIGTMPQIRVLQSIVAGSDPFLAFNNTAFAVELGLLEVVKFLIENKGVDPNEYDWTLNYTSTYGRHYRVHLVSAAMTFRRKDIFQYLLSLPSTNLYSEIDDNMQRIRNHGLFEQALDIYVGRTKENTFLMSIVNHTRFDINRACHRYASYSPYRYSIFTCLLIALYRLENCLGGFEERYGPSGSADPDLTDTDCECLDSHIAAINLLLETGANPAQIVSEGVGSGIDIVEMWMREAHPNVGYPSIHLLKKRVYRQVRTTMREMQAP